MTGNTKATLVDATALEGGIQVTTTNTTDAETVQGGIGADTISADTANAIIYGNDGIDEITVTANATSAVIDGGAGADIFDITDAALGVEAFATFNNVGTGDTFKFDAATFSSDAVSMTLTDPTESDYINAAFAQTADNKAIWFQYTSNAGVTSTYIVVNDADEASAAYGDGGGTLADGDVVVKLAGAIDLSTASFNSDDGTLEIA